MKLAKRLLSVPQLQLARGQRYICTVVTKFWLSAQNKFNSQSLLWWKIFDNFLEILYPINLFRGNFIILFSFDICLKLVAVNQNEDWVTVHFLDFDHKHCTSNISNFHIKFNSILQKYHKSKMDEKGWLITKRGEKHKHSQTNSWAVYEIRFTQLYISSWEKRRRKNCQILFDKLCIISLMWDRLTLAQECVKTETPEPTSSVDLFFNHFGHEDKPLNSAPEIVYHLPFPQNQNEEHLDSRWLKMVQRLNFHIKGKLAKSYQSKFHFSTCWAKQNPWTSNITMHDLC